MQDFALEICNKQNISDCDNREFKLSYEQYQSYQGEEQKSGAYIFRPNEKTISGSIPYAQPKRASISIGNTISQITVIGREKN